MAELCQMSLLTVAYLPLGHAPRWPPTEKLASHTLQSSVSDYIQTNRVDDTPARETAYRLSVVVDNPIDVHVSLAYYNYFAKR